MKTTRIAFFDTKLFDQEFFDAVNTRYGYSIKYYKYHLNPETASLTGGYEVVCVLVNDVLNAEVIDDDVLARLLTFNNVLITSHQGFFTREALTSIAEVTMENIHAFVENNKLENEICYKCERDHCMKKETGRCF